MLARGIATLLVVCFAAGTLAASATADETSAWEAEIRDTFGGQLSAATSDLFSGPPQVFWRRGPTLQTPKEALAMHVGWEIQTDLTAYGDMAQEVEDAAQDRWTSGGYMRRNRITVEGFFLKYWYVRARYGVNGFTGLDFADLFVEWSGLHALGRDAPVFRVGQVKEPITLDWMNNAKWPTFAERGMVTTSIVPNRTPGIRLHGNGFGRRLSYQLGAFLVGESRLTTNRQSDDAWAVTGRVTGLPWVSKRQPNRLLHLGLSGSHRWKLDRVQYASKLETWRGPEAISTGEINAKSVTVGAAEAFYQEGRFSVLCEGAITHVRRSDGGTTNFWGGYIQASYFLTGPGINYSRGFGVFGRVKPRCTIFCPAKRGWGAFEVAARYSVLDLDSGPLPGGRAWTITLGVNGANAYGVQAADSTLNTLSLRTQYDF
ncbi:MAG: porin [Planctomycetota bacterium]|nr:porin [Planctomycetota bacterium]